MKIAVAGAAGRMGQMLVRRIAAHRRLHPGRGERMAPTATRIGRDAGEVAGLEQPAA